MENAKRVGEPIDLITSTVLRDLPTPPLAPPAGYPKSRRRRTVTGGHPLKKSNPVTCDPHPEEVSGRTRAIRPSPALRSGFSEYVHQNSSDNGVGPQCHGRPEST